MNFIKEDKEKINSHSYFYILYRLNLNIIINLFN